MRENLKSKTGTTYMRRFFFYLNCSGAPCCAPLYATCTGIRVVFVKAPLHSVHVAGEDAAWLMRRLFIDKNITFLDVILNIFTR